VDHSAPSVRRQQNLWLARGQIRVKGKINDVSLRTTLRPRGDGTHYLVVNRGLRGRIGAAAGDRVQVTIDIDKTPRRVSLPRDFAAALTRSPAAKTHFRALSPSHQEAYVEYIREAKRPETRRRRVEARLDRLEEEAGRSRKPG